MYLIADFGGTNYNIGVVSNLKSFHFKFKEKDKHNNFVAVSEVINFFLKKNNLNPKEITASVISFAGAKENNYKLSNNNSLVVDLEQISSLLTEVFFLNDFEAIGYSIPILESNEVEAIRETHSKDPRKVVIGPGTGLGVVSLINDEQKLSVQPSEGGQLEFPARTHREFDFVDFLKSNYDNDLIVYDDILSGIGLERLYVYLQRGLYNDELPNLTAAQISKTKNSNECSKEAFRLFYYYLARFAKAVTLDRLSLGGLYLVGGVLQKNSELLDKDEFLHEFNHDQIMSSLLREVPIYVISSYDINLKGGFNYLRENLLKK